LADVPRKNVEALALRLLGAGPHAARQLRALQQFIGEGAWDDTAILAEQQRFVAEMLGESDGVLILEGSDVPKRGVHSAGVAAPMPRHHRLQPFPIEARHQPPHRIPRPPPCGTRRLGRAGPCRHG
jgi:hypothetical protein